MARKIKSQNTEIQAPSTYAKNGFIQSELQNDNIYVDAKIVDMKELTGMPASSKFSKAIVSEGKIVNCVSDNYGFLPNHKFFLEVESNLMEGDLNYVTRSINRDDSHFAVDYILSDDRYHVDVQSGNDTIAPMLRFTNSYAGGPTSGSLGFFRKVCDNGLHTAQTKVGFKIRHKSTIEGIVLPQIKGIVEEFMVNEFFQLKRKFEIMAETKIDDLNGWVEAVANDLNLFKFAKSEENPEPSKTAQMLIDLVNVEANKVSAKDINVWLGYNAFNQYIHNVKVASFTEQKNLDQKLFEHLMEAAV